MGKFGDFISKAVSAVPLIGPAVGGVIDWIGSNTQAKKEREFNREMAEYAYSKDLEMWERTNEYNTPQNQMKRFEEAGLNKNLIYGQGSPGLAVASMPKYQDVKGTFGQQTPDLLRMINEYQDYKIKAAQTDLLKENIRNTKLQGNIRWYEEGLKKLKLYSSDPESDFNERFGLKSSTEYDLQAKEQETRKREIAIRKMLAEAGIKESDEKWKKMKLDVFDKTNVNIDKDALIERMISDVFGDVINKYSNKLKQSIK